MTVITVSYPQQGFLCSDKSSITPPKYAQRLHFSSRSQRSLSDATSKRRRILKIVVVTAKSGMAIEKQEEFKPSFEEYLKAMETVKSRREKRKVSTETPSSSSSSSSSPLPKTDERALELSDSQDQISIQKVENLKQVEVKKTWYRKKTDPKETQVAEKVRDINRIPENNEKYENFQGQRFIMKRGSDINSVSSESYLKNAAVNKEKTVVLNSKQDDVMKKWTRQKLDSKEGKIDTNTFQKNEVKHAKFQEQSFDMKKMSVKSNRLPSYITVFTLDFS